MKPADGVDENLSHPTGATASAVMNSDEIPHRKFLPHGVPGWANPGSEFFVTGCCASRGENHLCRPEIAAGLKESIGHHHRQRRWFVHLFVLMPDHWHSILAFPDNALRSPISDWKRFTARKLGIIWQHDFFDHRLRNDSEYEEKAAYIRNNPVRRGLISRAEDWRYTWDSRDFEEEPDGKVTG